MNREKRNRLAQIIWDYHHMNHKLEKADLIFVLGSHDIRVADWAARLFHEQWAPCILFSGGIAHDQDLLATGWEKSEAETFAGRAISLGVPENKIFLETKSRNTGENVLFSQKILEEKTLKHDSIIAVQKPYMERRTYATIRVYWPDIKLNISSPSIALNEYPTAEITMTHIINIMMGDLQRIIEYPARGFQISQEIPDKVMNAYTTLIEAGFTSHMLH